MLISPQDIRNRSQRIGPLLRGGDHNRRHTNLAFAITKIRKDLELQPCSEAGLAQILFDPYVEIERVVAVDNVESHLVRIADPDALRLVQSEGTKLLPSLLTQLTLTVVVLAHARSDGTRDRSNARGDADTYYESRGLLERLDWAAGQTRLPGDPALHNLVTLYRLHNIPIMAAIDVVVAAAAADPATALKEF